MHWLHRESVLGNAGAGLATLIGVVLCLAPSTATAQEPRRLFEQGASLYDDGEYAEAAVLWERAWSLEPRPALQYNLAQAYERLGHGNAALTAYERYLRGEETDNENRRRAVRRAEALRRRLVAEAAASPPAAAAAARSEGLPSRDEAYPSSPEAQPASPTLGPVVGGVAVLCAIAAAITGGLALREANANPHDPGTAYALAAATDVLVPTALGLGLVSAVTWVLAPEVGAAQPSAGLSLRGEFP